MKTSKKITVAALSAATALVGATGAVSSFAWFAMNGTVTASGMHIKADSTNAFLEIKSSNANWPEGSSSLTASYSDDPKTLSPTHLIKKTEEITLKSLEGLTYDSANGSEHSWVASTSNDANKYNSNGTYTVVTNEADSGLKYTLVASFDLRLRYTESAKANTYKLNANISWANESELALKDAARVFMVISNSQDESIEVNSSTASKGFVFDARTKAGWGKEAEALKTITISDSFKAKEDNKGTRVSLFFYFDGEDEACTTANAVADSTYSIAATFSVTAAA